MICSLCKNRNPVGNKFCRDCGAKLSPPEGELAAEETARLEKERLHERVAGLLSAAFTLAEQKRYEQSLPLAREAALLLPDSTAAHSLLASLYERTDQEREAIRAMERVVALNPDSTADQEKLDQLRRGVHVLPRTGTVSSPAGGANNDFAASPSVTSSGAKLPYWLPFVAGGAAAAVVLGIGLSTFSRQNNQNALPMRTTLNNAAAANAIGGTPAPSGPYAPAGAFALSGNTPPPGAPAKGTLPPAGEVRSDPFVSLGIAGNAANAVNGTAKPYAAANRAAGTTLPPLPFRAAPRSENAAAITPTVGSVLPSSAADRTLPPIIAVPPSGAGADASGFGMGQRLSVGPPPSAGQTDNGAAAAASENTSRPNSPGDNGYIRITVGGSGGNPIRNNGGRQRGGSAETPAAPTESSLARARRLQSAGHYAEAADAYRESLGSGSSGDIHQGIAECRHRLGDDAGARNEYQSAITAYEREASSGRNVAGSQRAAAACRAALEALGG